MDFTLQEERLKRKFSNDVCRGKRLAPPRKGYRAHAENFGHSIEHELEASLEKLWMRLKEKILKKRIKPS